LTVAHNKSVDPSLDNGKYKTLDFEFQLGTHGGGYREPVKNTKETKTDSHAATKVSDAYIDGSGVYHAARYRCPGSLTTQTSSQCYDNYILFSTNASSFTGGAKDMVPGSVTEKGNEASPATISGSIVPRDPFGYGVVYARPDHDIEFLHYVHKGYWDMKSTKDPGILGNSKETSCDIYVQSPGVAWTKVPAANHHPAVPTSRTNCKGLSDTAAKNLEFVTETYKVKKKSSDNNVGQKYKQGMENSKPTYTYHKNFVCDKIQQISPTHSSYNDGRNKGEYCLARV
jgi:hypothetical protein